MVVKVALIVLLVVVLFMFIIKNTNERMQIGASGNDVSSTYHPLFDAYGLVPGEYHPVYDTGHSFHHGIHTTTPEFGGHVHHLSSPSHGHIFNDATPPHARPVMSVYQQKE